RPCHHLVTAPPCPVRGREFGAAAQAGAETGRFRRGRAGVIGDVARLGRRRRAHRTTVDAGAGDRGEEQPVEARVAALAGPFADLAGGEGGSVRHAGRLAPAQGPNWPFSDMDAATWMSPGLRSVERSLLR